MRILHLASEYPPQKVFGLGRFVRDLAEEQVRQGHEAVVITNSMSGDHADEMQGGVRVLRVDYPPPPRPPLTSGCVLVFNLMILRRALGLGADFLSRFDAVCSHDWLTAPAAQALQNAFGVPHVCTFHDVIVGKRLGRLDDPIARFTSEAERWVTQTAAHLVANSRATQEELIRHYQADPKRISVVPCAIAPRTFAITDDPVRLLKA